jgi:hypothetical protein
MRHGTKVSFHRKRVSLQVSDICPGNVQPYVPDGTGAQCQNAYSTRVPSGHPAHAHVSSLLIFRTFSDPSYAGIRSIGARLRSGVRVFSFVVINDGLRVSFSVTPGCGDEPSYGKLTKSHRL